MKFENSRRQSGDSNRRNSGGNNRSTPVRKRKPQNEDSVWTFKGTDDDQLKVRNTRSGNRTTSPTRTTQRRNEGEDNNRKIIKKAEKKDERRPLSSKSGDIRERSERRLQDRKERYGGGRDQRPAPARKVISRKKRSEPKDDVRLNKFIANSGICSRREADEFIEAGVVTVNGQVVTTLGTRVKPTDDIRFNGQRLQGEKKVYILLNKPKGYVTTVEDPHADETVMDLIRGACKERVYPVGRLDKNTTGVLLLTNDGELTKTLTHPSNEKMKIYHAHLDKPLTKNDLQKLVDGFELEDGFTYADAAEYVEGKKEEIGIEIHSGRNRIVRRMFEHLGYKVTKLDRVYFAGLTKKGLKRGAWRILNDKEVSILKMGQFA